MTLDDVRCHNESTLICTVTVTMRTLLANTRYRNPEESERP